MQIPFISTLKINNDTNKRMSFLLMLLLLFLVVVVMVCIYCEFDVSIIHAFEYTLFTWLVLSLKRIINYELFIDLWLLFHLKMNVCGCVCVCVVSVLLTIEHSSNRFGLKLKMKIFYIFVNLSEPKSKNGYFEKLVLKEW